MAHVNKVIRSINAEGAPLCVDVFRRPDGSFGFEEFRRDPEDGRGWYPVGHHGHRVFDSLYQAVQSLTHGGFPKRQKSESMAVGLGGHCHGCSDGIAGGF